MAEQVKSSTLEAPRSFLDQVHRSTLEASRSFLDQVKREYADQPDKYKEFLTILKDFSKGRDSQLRVVYAAADFLQGHPDLIVAFSKFLPIGVQIDPQTTVVSISREYGHSSRAKRTYNNSMADQVKYVTVEASRTFLDQVKRSTIQAARSFLRQVEREYADQPDKYKEFLEILNDLGKGSDAEQDAICSAPDFLEGHPDLIIALNKFLPVGVEMDPASAILIFAAEYGHSSQAKRSYSNSMPGQVKCSSLEASRPFLDQVMLSTIESSRSFLDQVKREYADRPDKYKEFMKILNDFTKERDPELDVIYTAVDFLLGHPDLIEVFIKFLPVGVQIDLENAIVTISPVYGRYRQAQRSFNKSEENSEKIFKPLRL